MGNPEPHAWRSLFHSRRCNLGRPRRKKRLPVRVVSFDEAMKGKSPNATIDPSTMVKGNTNFLGTIHTFWPVQSESAPPSSKRPTVDKLWGEALGSGPS